ncbi:MAG: hypothetical protein AB1679_03690 [Actinomycetota bacterium]|jgi:hypothetical protein
MAVLVILGIGLVIFGGIVLLLLPDRPGGELSFRGATLKSPTAGLPLIVVGVAAVWLGYAYPAPSAGARPAPGPSTTEPRPDTSTTATTASPDTTITTRTTGCVIRVDHIGARISEKPSHDARELASVPAGEYPTFGFTVANWAGRNEGWFLIKVNGRQGWIVDNGILITDKSSACS